jgi:uncharacterized protein YndB with AHSA1/START domain
MPTATTGASVTTQVYRVFIKATPEAIWDAITKPEWNDKYGYRARAEYDLRPGGKYQAFANGPMLEHGAPSVMVEGEVIEADRPRKLVQTWQAVWDPKMAAERVTRITWDIEAGPAGITSLTVTHELEGAPTVAAQVSGSDPNAGGGWSWVLSDLKTLLETGQALAG